ncbi:GNAT family N-acetyltransferase [Taklimakanibacter lacteus]|uniref:GNAT family N-acetyltransferase n=1 Tax=Taklimakanibacter lacteus TaxID=2268456 RepID=UPI000E66C4F3
MAGLTPVVVARAGAGDKADWVRLWRLWQRHMSGEVPENVTERTWQMALAPASHLLILLARAGTGEAIGFATVSFAPFAWTGSDVAFLQDLFVDEARRGSGAGEALLKAIYAEADLRGASQVYWMVDETDGTLQRFYERHAIRTPYLRYMRTPWPW